MRATPQINREKAMGTPKAMAPNKERTNTAMVIWNSLDLLGWD
jgi:hypothetical protein